jgi:hypothetical protein
MRVLKQQERDRTRRDFEGTRKMRDLERQAAAADFTFEPRDLDSATEKLSRAALSYDKFSTSAPSLEVGWGFQCLAVISPDLTGARLCL